VVQASTPADLGLVSQCDVINCTYNEDQQCTAGAIDVTFVDALAQCYTYTTEEPTSSVQVGMGAGDVSECDVIDCTYNEGQRCTADSITVTFVDDKAQCATYTHSSGATG
jgi:hypothetical protein